MGGKIALHLVRDEGNRGLGGGIRRYERCKSGTDAGMFPMMRETRPGLDSGVTFHIETDFVVRPLVRHATRLGFAEYYVQIYNRG
jgi:hypothetical protein